MPDSGNRYLSKVFNDDWMRENGMLDEGLGFGIIDDLMKQKRGREIITIEPGDSAESVIRKMRTYGISQFPVVQKGKLMGIVGEADLIHPLYDGDIKTEEPIEPLIRKNFSQVSPEDSISKLAEILESGNSCVVMSENKIDGIITKIDLISYLSERMKKEGKGS